MRLKQWIYEAMAVFHHSRYKTDGIKHHAIDIDGVDMRRWFQWEDDGMIPVEIDFPTIKIQQNFNINVSSPNGDFYWTIVDYKE